MRPKPRLALVRGCAVCDVARADTLALPTGEALCRRCAARLGAFVRRAREDWLETAWSRAAPPLPPPRAGQHEEKRADESLEAGVASTLRPDDLRAHYDLAAAYHAMGLAYDVLPEVALGLSENASNEWAQSALAWMFDARHARPDAFARIVTALRAS